MPEGVCKQRGGRWNPVLSFLFLRPSPVFPRSLERAVKLQHGHHAGRKDVDASACSDPSDNSASVITQLV